MARLRSSTIAVIVGSLTLAAAAPARADEPVADTTAPVITSTGLTPGQLIGAYQVFKPIISDNIGVTEVQVLLNGTVHLTVKTALWSGLIRLDADKLTDVTDLAITIRVKDAAGNTSEATTHVTLDAKPPTAVPTPAVGTVLEPGPVTVTLAGVPDDIAEITLIDSGHTITTGTEGPWAFAWTASEDSTGLTFKLTDKAGNQTSLDPQYVVDGSAPVIQRLDYQAPYGPSQSAVPGTAMTVGAAAGISADITDRSRINRIEWWVDGVLRGTGATALNLEPSMTSGTAATVEVRAWDAAGHAATASFPLTIDRTGPAVTVLTPSDLALVRGTTLRSSVTASDPNGIGRIGVAGLPGTGTSASVPLGRDGQFTVTWQATDRLGNQSSTRRTVTVDNTKPTVAISSAPRNGAKLTKSTAIRATAADRNGIVRVQLLVNGKLVATDTRAGYAFTVNPKKYGKTFTVQLRAYDRAGNIQYSSKRTYHR